MVAKYIFQAPSENLIPYQIGVTQDDLNKLNIPVPPLVQPYPRVSQSVFIEDCKSNNYLLFEPQLHIIPMITTHSEMPS